ncbi:unannotated protein [freshwater metagenome]|uniref:Unannotated protein n=1 Tax=freshwater metagenome TaxID=449393 RepID=A0A6J7IBS5_9ZZZZ
MERVLELRDLVLHHFNFGRLLHDLLLRMEQRRPDRHLHRMANHRSTHPCHRILHVGACLRLSDLGRHLLVGIEAGRHQGRLLHRMAEPGRPHRHRCFSRLRGCDLLRLQHFEVQRVVGCGLFARACLRHLPRHPAPHGTREHLLEPPACCLQQHLSVVACCRCRDRRHHPCLLPEGGGNPLGRHGCVHRSCEQHLRTSRKHGWCTERRRNERPGLLVLRPAPRLPSYPVHDHRVRRLRSSLGRDARSR